MASHPTQATEPDPPDRDQEAPTPLHLAAQQGDLDTLYRLLDHPDDRTTTAADPDAQGITPLHWAAINSHILFCKALLERGAEPDLRGGELAATPLMWAARQGHLAVVHLLIKYGADPTLTDSQQFNALHLAVHSSSAFLVAYLLNTLQPLAVDAQDPEGHTALAWACYQGDAISVQLLLGAGADVLKTDHAGLTPLHWAVTKGNSTCIRHVVQAGADLHARTHEGKTAREMAIELKSLPAYERALVEAGLDPLTGRPQQDVPFKTPSRTNLAIFVVVGVAFGVMFETWALLPWYSSVILVAAEAYAMHHLVSRVILGVRSTPKHAHHGHSHGHGHAHGHGHGSERVTKSAYLCAVITASLAWVFYVWVTRIVLRESGTSVRWAFLLANSGRTPRARRRTVGLLDHLAPVCVAVPLVLLQLFPRHHPRPGNRARSETWLGGTQRGEFSSAWGDGGRLSLLMHERMVAHACAGHRRYGRERQL